MFATLVSDDLGLLTRTLDHLLGKTLNEYLIHAECEALIELATDYEADVVVDAWNPFVCIAARVMQQAYGGHPQRRVLSKTLCLYPETAGVTPAYFGILENGRRLEVATASPPSFGV